MSEFNHNDADAIEKYLDEHISETGNVTMKASDIYALLQAFRDADTCARACMDSHTDIEMENMYLRKETAWLAKILANHKLCMGADAHDCFHKSNCLACWCEEARKAVRTRKDL